MVFANFATPPQCNVWCGWLGCLCAFLHVATQFLMANGTHAMPRHLPIERPDGSHGRIKVIIIYDMFVSYKWEQPERDRRPIAYFTTISPKHIYNIIYIYNFHIGMEILRFLLAMCGVPNSSRPFSLFPQINHPFTSQFVVVIYIYIFKFQLVLLCTIL